MIKHIISLTTAKTAIEFVNASLPLLISCNVTDKEKFINVALENFDSMKPSEEILNHDYGVRLYSMLKGSKPPVTEFISCFCIVLPHSMTVERSVSTYNMLFSDLRMATAEQTLVDRLLIHWYSTPTALYDPRPAVQKFMLSKDRRMNVERDFIKKSFR